MKQPEQGKPLRLLLTFIIASAILLAATDVKSQCNTSCQFTTYTMGGWGSIPHGNNPGSYLQENFNATFPSGLYIGCNNTLVLTSAQAISEFLPSGSTAGALPYGKLFNPGNSYSNVLAGQLVAASLNVGFDAYDSTFSSDANSLGDLQIAFGIFQGWTVAQLLDSANNYIGGCGSTYTASQFNDALAQINENFDNGSVNLGYVDCEPITIVLTGTDITCSKADNGSASVNAAGGSGTYSFLWSHGSTTKDISGLAPGVYTITVTDGKNCSMEASVEIEEVSSWIYISFEVTHAVCNNSASGSIETSISGGIAPYSYLWSNGETTGNISSLLPAFYTLTVTDANGCTNSNVTYINNPPALSPSVTKIKPVCGVNGAIDLTVVNGTAPYSFEWSNGAITEDISGLIPGYYTVSITDAKGCSALFTTRMWGVEAMKLKMLSLTHTSDKICDGAMDIKVNYGTAPFSYQWSNGATTQDLNNLCAGAYKLTVTDAQGCSIQKTWRVLYSKDVVPARLGSMEVFTDQKISLLSVYPSPAKDHATVRILFESPGKADITIFNMIGKAEKLVKAIDVSGGVLMEVKLEVNDLAPGTYLIYITQNGISVQEKLQIVK